MTIATEGKVKQVAADKVAKLELRINVGSAAKNGDPVTFTIHKVSDDSQLDIVDGTITKGKAVGDWTAKGPEPTGQDRSWRIYYKVVIGVEEAVSPELEVYLDSLELTSQDETGASLADAGFTVFVGKDEKGKRATTGSSGTFKMTGLPPGEPVRVVWKAPMRQVGDWVEDGAGKKTAKLKKSFKAKLISPEAGDHVQWTNLAVDKKAPERGSKLRVRAGCVDEDGPTRKGDVFYVKVTWPDAATLSKRTSPRRALPGGKTTDWSGDGVGKTIEIKQDGADCVFEVELGMAGLDQVTIEVAGTDTIDDGDDAKVVVTNRRKLFFQVTHRDTLAAIPDMQTMADCLDEGAITYERYGLEKVKEADEGVPAGAFFDGATVGMAGERLLCIGDHNKKWFHEKKFKDDKKPIGVHVLFCDVQLDAGEKQPLTETFSFLMDGPTATVSTEERPFPIAMFDGKAAISAASWESDAPKGHADRGKKGGLSQADFEVNPFEREVKVKLPAPAKDLVGDGSGDKKKVRVRFKIKVAEGFFFGESSGVKQLLAMKRRAPTNDKLIDQTDKEICDTMSHELGHTMRQTVKKSTVPPGLKLEDHGRHYSFHGHSGPHCADGMSQGDYDTLESFENKDECTCVMYGEYNDACTGKFCARCKPFLLAERLESL